METSRQFQDALDDDRDAAVAMFLRFIETHADSTDESVEFVVACLSDYLTGLQPGMNGDQVGDLLRTALRQKGRQKPNAERDRAILISAVFYREDGVDHSSKSTDSHFLRRRNKHILDLLKARDLDGGKSDKELTKIIKNVLYATTR